MAKARFFTPIVVAAIGTLAVLGLLIAPHMALAAGQVGNGTPGSCTSVDFYSKAISGGLVTFDCGGPATIVITSALSTGSDTTIDGTNNGNPLTLTASSGLRPFTINSGTALTLANVTIANLNYTSYPIYNQGTLFISNSTFMSNANYLINNVLSSSSLNIANSSFYSTTNSAIYNFGAVTVTGSLFMSNTSGSGAALNNVTNSSHATISNSSFISNTGGALYTNGPLTITASTFKDNYAGVGAAIGVVGSAGAATIDSSDFISNNMPFVGFPPIGGTIFDASSKPLSISNSHFYGNRGGTGAAIILNGYGLSPSPALTLTSSSIMSNTSGGGASAIDCEYCVLYISNTLIMSNTSLSVAQESAIYFQYPGSAQILSSTFAYNTGAIDTNSSAVPLIVSDSSFISNTTNGSTAGIRTFWITLTHSSFIGNQSNSNNFSGALDMSGPTYITGSTFIGNSGWQVGGIMLSSGTSAEYEDTIINSVIQNNVGLTYDGGGIRSGEALNLINSDISGNTSIHGNGAGLYYFNSTSPMTVTNSLFYNNTISRTGSLGGGAYSFGPATFINNTFYSNTASSGGGLYISGGSVTLTNNTLVSNTATGLNGGGNLRNGYYLGNNVALKNTIIANGTCAGGFASLGHNLSNAGTCPITATGDISGVNPLLGNFQDNGGSTYSLMPTANSPAINAGDNTNCPSDDQRGVARPYATYCDIGAIESPFKTPQTITFNALPDRISGDPTFDVTATASSSLSVTIGSLTTGVCSINNNTVTLITGGQCTLEASQAGDATYAAAPNVDRTFTIFFTQTITFNQPASPYATDAPFPITATTSSGLPVSFNTSGVCSISGITITLSGIAGTCSITATQAGNAAYTPAPSIAQNISVLLAPQSIAFDPIASKIAIDAPFTITASASSSLAVSFNTSGVCSITGITITLSGIAGTCSITATQSGNATYAAAVSINQTVTVALASQSISFGALPDRKISDAAFVVTATATSGLTVSFTTSGPCTSTGVNGSTITLIDAGTCSVTAHQTGDATYSAASDVAQSFAITKWFVFLPLAVKNF